MNKKFLAVIFLMLAVCTAGCNFGKSSNKYVNPKKIIKSKNEVPQTYEEYVAKYGEPPKASKNQVQKRKTDSPFAAAQKQQTKPASGFQSNKQLLGEEIPSWVYDNTTSSDDYSDVIKSFNNIVFFAYADCPIGRGRRDMVSSAISRAGASGKFVMNADLHEVGSSTVGICKNGAEQCAIHYLLDNCMGQICIINPRQRRIVFVAPDENALISKLSELKNNW